MSAEEAFDLYKSRDSSEKLFRGDKSYLGNKSFRVHGSESVNSKIFKEILKAFDLTETGFSRSLDEILTFLNENNDRNS